MRRMRADERTNIMDHDVIEATAERRLRLVQDVDCVNPREDFDHFAGVFAAPSRDYLTIAEPGELAERARYLFDRYRIDQAFRIFDRWVRVCHGGVTLWDTAAMPMAVWYATPAMVEAAGTPADLIAELVRGERDEYRAWAEGDCWGYVIEEAAHYNRIDEGHEDETFDRWEETDSCWGFIGHKYAEEEARAAFAD